MERLSELKKVFTFWIGLLIFLIFPYVAFSQNSSIVARGEQPSLSNLTIEEKIILTIYRRISINASIYNAHQNHSQTLIANHPDAIQLYVRAIGSGDVGELLPSPIGSLVSIGPEIQVKLEPQFHKGKRYALIGYKATMEKTPIDDFAVQNGARTLAEIFASDPLSSYDIRKYVTYEVSLMYAGMSLVYRAIALFHDPYLSESKNLVEIWDPVLYLPEGLGSLATRRHLGASGSGSGGNIVSLDYACNYAECPYGYWDTGYDDGLCCDSYWNCCALNCDPYEAMAIVAMDYESGYIACSEINLGGGDPYGDPGGGGPDPGGGGGGDPDVDPQEPEAGGIDRDCDQEHIECYRRCWGSRPPWPVRYHKWEHRGYCSAKCLNEYMECLAALAADRVFQAMEDAVDWLAHHSEVVVGTVVVVACVVFVVATDGAGALILVAV